MKSKRIIQSLAAVAVAATASVAFAQVPVYDRPPAAAMFDPAAAMAQLKPWSGPSGSPEAAKDEGITFMSFLLGVPKDGLTAELESFDGNAASVAVTETKVGRTCRYQMLKNATQNAFGWEMHNPGVCSQS